MFLIPGGEQDAQMVYEKLAAFLEACDDLSLTVYRAQNVHDQTWSLIIISEIPSLSRYQEQILSLLSEMRGQPLDVPPESLMPLVQRFLTTQADMRRKKLTFLKKQYERS